MKGYSQIHRSRETSFDSLLVTTRLWQNLSCSCDRKFSWSWFLSSFGSTRQKRRCNQNNIKSSIEFQGRSSDNSLSRWDPSLDQVSARCTPSVGWERHCDTHRCHNWESEFYCDQCSPLTLSYLYPRVYNSRRSCYVHREKYESDSGTISKDYIQKYRNTRTHCQTLMRRSS